MSRCFPFPPPGYEKKARIDDVDLLKKDKHRERKHKKEKKDKEKREDKDRKERDKSEGKNRNKKDRKEKSKEKKKDKEKTTPAQVDSCNGDHKLNHKEKEVKYQNIISNETKQSTSLHGHIGDKPEQRSFSNEGNMDKFVLDLCNRIKDEGKGSASQSMEKSSFTGRTNHAPMAKTENGIFPFEKEKKRDRRVDDIRTMGVQGVRVGPAISATRPVTLVQNKIENKGVDISGGFQNRAEEVPRISASTLVQNIVEKEKTENGINTSGGFQNRVDEFPRIFEKSIQQKDKNHKRKDKDKKKKKKKSHKEKKKEEKNVQKIEDHGEVKGSTTNDLLVHQNIKLPLVPDDNRNLIVKPNIKLPQVFPGGHKNLIPGQNMNLANLKKRKDTEANGFLHETNFVPNKLLKPSPVLHTPDRKLAPPNNLSKVNNNEHKINGMIEVQPLSISLKKPYSSPSSSSSSRTEADQIAQAPATKPCLRDPTDKINQAPVVKPRHPDNSDKISRAPVVKPPHPDAKYLNEVLSVPKIEESFDFDDEEWLFSSKDRVSLSSGLTKNTLSVWDKALQIKSADICALPYVIPY